jgi:hypothetical protein
MMVVHQKKGHMVATEQKTDFLFVRFTSDLVTAYDVVSIKSALQQALENGIRNIALSVMVGSLSNQHFISRILRQCKEIVQRENGNLYFVELGDEMNSMYHSICQTLEIPMFESEDKIDQAVSLHVVV